MSTHKYEYANVLYKIYELLGLFKKNTNRRDLRNHSNFSSHQLFFKSAIDEIIDTIDTHEVISKEQRKIFYYKYEQLYNKFINTTMLSPLNKNEITILFTNILIPAAIALDMSVTLKHHKKSEEPIFYEHIHNFLFSDYYIKNKSDTKLIFSGAKKYLKEYIKSLDFDSILDLSSIYSLIDNIRVNSKQRTSTINQSIDICISKSILIGYKDRYKFEFLRTVYTSINTLLLFQQETLLLNNLYEIYNNICKGTVPKNHPVLALNSYLHSETNLLIKYGLEGNLIDKESSNVINSVIKYLNIPQVKSPYSISIANRIESFIFIIDEPVRYRKPFIHILKNIINKSDDKAILKPYSEFVDIIISLQNNNAEKALKLIEKTNMSDLPFGFLNSAISIINLALKIKLNKKIIRNGSLIPQVNSIISTNRIHFKYIIGVHNIKEDKIISNANNFTIMLSIRTFNVIINKINPNKSATPSYINPQSIHGLLNNLDKSIGKLKEINFNLEVETIAEQIVSEELYSFSSLNKNLISILNDCTLFQCIGCLPTLCYFLQVPGEEFKNISYFMKKNIFEITKIQDTLKVVENILYKNKKIRNN
ncbi:TPA: hypothetical protein VEO38_001121 [Providencia alcalifaciens]|nr:hypothetical protein [Providencia alcalifaciens]